MQVYQESAGPGEEVSTTPALLVGKVLQNSAARGLIQNSNQIKDFSFFLPGCQSVLSHVHTCYHSFGSICFNLVIQNRNSQIESLGQKLMKRITGGISKLDDPGTSPRPDSGRKRAWVCVFPILCEHTEHWAGGGLCSSGFSFSWPLALAFTACFLQSRLLEAMALLYSLCRVPGTVRPWSWPGPGRKWSSLAKSLTALWNRLRANSPLPSVRDLHLYFQCHGFGGISGRVWVWAQTPPLGADTARDWQNPVWHNCAGFRICAQYPCSSNCTDESMGSFSVQMNSKEHQP